MYTKKSRKKLFPVILLLAIALCIPAFAESIEELNIAKQQTKDTIYSTEERLAALESKRGDAESYLTELVSQIESLNSEFETLQNNYDEKQSELIEIQSELAKAKEDERNQYEDMKLRIKYMYESNTGLGPLEILFSGESFTDFLNNSEVISRINEFDRELMKTYEKTRLEIEEREALVLAEKEEILALKQECDEKRIQVQEIYQTEYNNMQEIIAGINEAESELSSLTAQLAAQDEQLQALLARSYAEDASGYEDIYIPSDEAVSQGEVSGGGDEGFVSEESGSSSEGGLSLSYLGHFTLTAYCPCARCNGVWAGKSASGAPLTANHTVATGGLPFGTRLYINGTIYTVEDTGTPYGWIDIFFNTHDEALDFGMHSADVYIVN